MSNNNRGVRMNNRYSIVINCLVLGLLALPGVVFAHGTEKHEKKAPVDAQMKKLHVMMPMFAVASARLEAALEKGDAYAVEVEAGKIQQAVPDLKKSKPHKNSNQRKKYVELATNLGTAVNTTVSLAQRGDFAGAKAAFKRVEELCSACHAKFSD